MSTDEQANEGYSLANQIGRIRQYASLYDLQIVAEFEDAGISAKNLDRPGIQGALAMLTQGAADALVVLKLDRLSRSVRDMAGLIETTFRRATLISVSEHIDTKTASGEMVLNMMSSVSQWERRVIGERTSAAMQEMKRQGRYTGGRVPYGFDPGPNGILLRNEDEQAKIALAVEQLGSGKSSYAIARDVFGNPAMRYWVWRLRK